MRKIIFIITIVFLLISRTSVTAANTEENTENQDTVTYTNIYIEEMLKEIGGKELDNYVEGRMDNRLTFTGLVKELALEDKSDYLNLIGQYVFDTFFYEIKSVREIMLQLICFVAAFAILNRGLITTRGYVYDMSFLMVYCAMMLLLVQSFGLIGQEVQRGIEQMITFLSVLIPAYSFALVFSGNATTAASFYCFAFAFIYILQWLLKVIILPLINMYMLIQMLDHIFEERKLSRLAELIEELVRLSLKFVVGIVIGTQVIQAFISPAKDRIADSIIMKSAQAIPGIGNMTEAGMEIIFSCGMLVKNSVGVAGLITLAVVIVLPIIKVLVFWLGYRFLSAALQPVSDMRIIDSLHEVSSGIGLYLRLLIDSSLLFFIMISMVCASTSFIQ